MTPTRALSNGERRRPHDRRQHAFEALARLRQLRGDDRRAGVHFDARLRGDQADDALGVGGARAECPIGCASGAEPVEPQRTVGIEQDFDDLRIIQRARR